jgi:hypothetical protein
MTTHGTGHLVNPVADTFEPRQPAPRRPELSGKVGLVDGMLNPSGLWGQGILDAVEAELRERFPEVGFERVSRPQLGASPPDVWASAMADRYSALVIAAGD